MGRTEPRAELRDQDLCLQIGSSLPSHYTLRYQQYRDRALLLKNALQYVPAYGFTRRSLALASQTSQTPDAEPLSETAISALFGRGDNARKTLIWAWLDQGKESMGPSLTNVNVNPDVSGHAPKKITVREALRARLEWNTPVLQYLPEVCIIDQAEISLAHIAEVIFFRHSFSSRALL